MIVDNYFDWLTRALKQYQRNNGYNINQKTYAMELTNCIWYCLFQDIWKVLQCRKGLAICFEEYGGSCVLKGDGAPMPSSSYMMPILIYVSDVTNQQTTYIILRTSANK